MNEKIIKEFIEEVFNSGRFDGCMYHAIDGKFYLVFAYGESCGGNDCLYGKIATNTDDLQCDYDWDWDMPEANSMSDDFEIIDTELSDCLSYTVDEAYDYFEEEYKYVTENID